MIQISKSMAALALTTALLVVAGCGGGASGKDANQPGQGKPLDQMRYLTRSNQADPLFTYWTVAEQLHFFDGIKSEVVHVDAGEQAIIAGQAEMTVSAPNSVISLLANDPNLNLISFFNQTPMPHYVLAVLPESPIKALKELKGKKIGVPSRGHSVNLAITGLLADAGLKENDVEVIVVPPGAAAANALKKGDVAMLAYHDTAVVQVEDLLKITLRTIPLSPSAAKIGGPLMVARRDDVEKNPDKYVRYIRGLLKAWLFVDANVDAAAKIQVKVFPELIAAGQTEADAIKTTARALAARHARSQLPTWVKAGSLYGENFEENWADWLPMMPDMKGKQVDWKRGYTNDLVKKGWQGIDKAQIEKLAKEYKG